MARQLIDSLAADFDPSKYRDEYRETVLEMIERKAEGQEITIQEAPDEPEEVPDLMAALEASIAQGKRQSKPSEGQGQGQGQAEGQEEDRCQEVAGGPRRGRRGASCASPTSRRSSTRRRGSPRAR